jgi:hypothetical protein
MPKSSKRPDAANTAGTAETETAAGGAAGAGVMAPPYDRDRVATRAYELYMARGGADGSDLEDWLTAERECCPPGEDIESRRE